MGILLKAKIKHQKEYCIPIKRQNVLNLQKNILSNYYIVKYNFGNILSKHMYKHTKK